MLRIFRKTALILLAIILTACAEDSQGGSQSDETHATNSTSSNTSIFPLPSHSSAKHLTAQQLAACTLKAADTYHIPPAVLIGIMAVEKGHVGKESKPDADGVYFMGPMRIDSLQLPKLAQIWEVDINTAHKWVRDDGCVNIHVAAWILRQKSNDGGSLHDGIAAYRPKNGEPDPSYADKVIAVMDEKGLIIHDIPIEHHDSESVVTFSTKHNDSYYKTGTDRGSAATTPFPIYDVASFCKDRHNFCDADQQHSYDISRGYWIMANNSEKAACVRQASVADSQLYVTLDICLKMVIEHDRVADELNKLDQPFHY